MRKPIKVKKKKSKIDGFGVFATANILGGEVIFSFKGKRMPFSSASIKKSQELFINSISAGEGFAFVPDDEDMLNYLNHSCSPNAYINDRNQLVSRKSIKSGQEVCIDYSLTEIDLYWRMYPCMCGSRRCRKVIVSAPILSNSNILKNIQYLQKRIKVYINKFWYNKIS